MAQNVANCIIKATPPGIDAEASGATVTITDTYEHRRYTLTVEAAEDTAEAWAVVELLDGLVQSVGIYTDHAEAMTERERITAEIDATAFMTAVELPQATPRRYEVAGFNRDSIEALIGPDINVTNADCEAIASRMLNRYLSSDNFATDLRAAVGEVLPDAENII